MISYITRFCLSIAITEMVVPLQKGLQANHDPDACHYDSIDNKTSTNPKIGGTFDWSEATQGLILSSFFWGYVLTQLPGGMLAERIGGKFTLGFGVLLPSICTLIIPIAAKEGGATGLIVVRFIMGLGQGFIYPSLNALLSKWAPLEERGRLGSLVFAGANFGNIVSMSISGFILSISNGNWPVLFYIYGSAGLVWFIVWLIFGYSSPETHPNLTKSEKDYLSEYFNDLHIKKVLPPTPWKAIFTSIPLWGLIIAQVGHDWGLFTIITDLPKYMKSVLHFSVAQNGFRSALPYAAMWITAIISGCLVDWILSKKILSVTNTRKVFTTFASVGPAIGIIGASYAGCDREVVTALFTLGMGLMGFFYPSLKVNPLDLSPNYAGTVMALTNGIGAISGIITPYLVGLLIPDSTMAQWRLVFWIAVGVLLLTNCIYVVTASGEVQPWNDPQTSKEKINEECEQTEMEANIKLEKN
uniref:Major facilitator superfamily (MFS) profile domain-containing protein n=1 Tax=Clastoptera arizonana TaxID=38151 RepID=A0A1B6C9M9_9HEMI